MPEPIKAKVIPYYIKAPMMDASVPSVEVPAGRFGRLVGVDGRFLGGLRKFYGMKEVADLDNKIGLMDTYDGPSFIQAVTFPKRGTSTIYRGFVVRWDEGNNNSHEAVDLFYTDDNGSTWETPIAIWAHSSSGISSTTEMGCAVDRGYLIIAVDGKATKTVYWNGSALVCVDSGPGDFGVELAALTDPDTKSIDSSYQLRGNGKFRVAWRFYNSVRGIYSSLSAPLVISIDIMKTTKATGIISFNSSGTHEGLMQEGDTFTINSKTYEYISGGSDVTIPVAGAATIAAHCTALADAITGYSATGGVSAVAGTASVSLEATTRGTAGNSYNLVVTVGGDDFSVSGPYLTGGGEDTTEPEEHCKAVLDFVANDAVVSGQAFADFDALFDKVEVFRTIDLGDAITSSGAIYYLEQTLDMPGNSSGWETLQVTLGTILDEALPFQQMYDPEKDVVSALPQSGSIGRYQGITFMAQATSTDGGYDTLNSSLNHISGEYFTTYNKRTGCAEEGRPLRYIASGDSMFILEPNAVVHVFKSTKDRPLVYTVLHRNRGLVGKAAAHAVGNSVFMITGTHLMLLNAVTGSMGQISRTSRILSIEWKSNLADIQSAYDSLLDASFFLNVAQKEMLVVWHATQMVTILEGANFVACSQTPDITTGKKTRAYFITATGLIVTPDDVEDGTGTMWGLSSNYTLDAAVDTASAGKNKIYDADAIFHADMIGSMIYMTSGANAGTARVITGYTAVSPPNPQYLTTAAFGSAIAVGDRYSISPVPFSARFAPLQIEEKVSKFRRWTMKGMVAKVHNTSGFSTNANAYWRIGAYRNGGSTLESGTDETLGISENPAADAGVITVDGITVEPYLEQISCGTSFELTAVEVPVTMGISRYAATS